MALTSVNLSVVLSTMRGTDMTRTDKQSLSVSPVAEVYLKDSVRRLVGELPARD